MPDTPTPTITVIPTDTPTNTPFPDFGDDGCAVGPVASTNPIGNPLLLLVPAILLWSRRRK